LSRLDLILAPDAGDSAAAQARTSPQDMDGSSEEELERKEQEAHT